MNKTRVLRIGVVAVVGLLLASFQGQSVASKLTLPLTTKGAQPAVAGRDFMTMYTVDPHGKSGASVGVLAIRDDGSAVISNNPPGVHGNLIAQAQVGIQIGKSRTWFPIQTGSKPRQTVEAVAGGKSVVWGETKSTDMSLDWRLFSETAGQNPPKALGDSFDLMKIDEMRYPPGVRMLATDGSNVWWVMVYPNLKSPNEWGAKIMVRDIGARRPLKIAVDRAKLPSAIAGGLIYVRSKDVDPSMPFNRYEIRIVKDGVDTLITAGSLAKDDQIFSSCASNTLLAWAIGSMRVSRLNPNVGPDGQLHVMTLATKAQRIVTLSDSASGSSLGCGTNFVAWGNGSGRGDPGQYVLDVPSGKIWKLGSAFGLSDVLDAGNILAWALPIPSGETAPWLVVKWHAV